MKREILGCALVALAATCAPGAVTTTIGTVSGTTVTTGSVASFEPTGEDMTGMLVTVRFADGETQTATWIAGPVGSHTGSASGTTSLGKTWTLSEAPGLSFFGVDTFGGRWDLTIDSGNSASPLIEVVLNGVPGDTLFDLKDPTESPLTPGMGNLAFTPGSERGWSFEVFNGSIFDMDVHASYENQVQVGANPILGDLFSTLRLTFGGASAGLPSGSTLIFFQDTDLSGEPLQQNPVPEPSSLAIVSGLAAAVGWRFRRRSDRPAI